MNNLFLLRKREQAKQIRLNAEVISGLKSFEAILNISEYFMPQLEAISWQWIVSPHTPIANFRMTPNVCDHLQRLLLHMSSCWYLVKVNLIFFRLTYFNVCILAYDSEFIPEELHFQVAE